MTEHKCAQVLRWVASGERIEHQGACKSHQTVLKLVASGYFSPEEFRLAPKTIKIGALKVEAPVLEPEEGQQVYFHSAWNPRDEVSVGSIRFNPKGNPRAVEMLRAKGLLFASAKACEEAHAAFSALLRGESC